MFIFLSIQLLILNQRPFHLHPYEILTIDSFPSIPWTMESSTPTNQSKTQGHSSQKRKTQPVTAVTLMRRKKIKTTIIDCPVALTLLKELGLNRSFFNSGTVLTWALEPTDPAFIRIHDYVYRGQKQGPADLQNFGCKVLGILQLMTKVDSLQNTAIPSDFSEDPNKKGELRKMLWHATSGPNVPKILQNGLKLPKHDPPNLYGKGIYFSDRIDFFLCSGSNEFKAGTKVYLFLCDVLLGNDLYKTESRRIRHGSKIKLNWPWQPSKILTVNNIQGRGYWIPDPKEDQLIDGCVWPLGEGVLDDNDNKRMNLKRNIYVVFNEMRVIPKYLVKVELTQNPVSEKLY